MVFIYLFIFTFEIWSPFVSIVWEITATELWNSSSVLWTLKLYLTFEQHEGE